MLCRLTCGGPAHLADRQGSLGPANPAPRARKAPRARVHGLAPRRGARAAVGRRRLRPAPPHRAARRLGRRRGTHEGLAGALRPARRPGTRRARTSHARGDFTQRDDYVCCGPLGGRLDASALRRRYHAARKAAGLRHVKLHGLRHGAGSLVARHTDAVFVQHLLGYAKLATTERYTHAKARREDIERLNLAFGVVPEPQLREP
jgi:integrase